MNHCTTPPVASNAAFRRSMEAATRSLDLLDSLKAEGFREGCPPRVSQEVFNADSRAYIRMECEVCGAKRQRIVPYRRGRDYRLVAICKACSNTTEV